MANDQTAGRSVEGLVRRVNHRVRTDRTNIIPHKGGPSGVVDQVGDTELLGDATNESLKQRYPIRIPFPVTVSGSVVAHGRKSTQPRRMNFCCPPDCFSGQLGVYMSE